MFDFCQLFQCPHAIKRHRTSPLLEERLRYLTYRAEQATARSYLRQIAFYQPIIIKYLGLEDNRIVTPQEIETAAKRWARYQTQHIRSKKHFSRASKSSFIRYATAWLRFLNRLNIPDPPPIAPQVIAFADYMREERGLSEGTIQYRCWTIQNFLSAIKDQHGTLAHLTAIDLDALLIQQLRQGHYARCTIQTQASSLRTFLRYAEGRGWCRQGLADAIKAPRVYKHDTLPSSPTWEEVKCLLKTTEGDHPTDIRDRAILLLLAVYGLRASEVRQLRLEELNWEQEILHLTRTKRGPTQQFPLTQAVGQALLRYLKDVRPRSAYRQIFLTLHAPFRPLSQGCFRSMLTRRWKPLNVPIKHHGSHALRHACATRLINQGMSLKVIADQLGHRDLDTTRLYAKVDLPRLREVANFNLGDLL